MVPCSPEIAAPSVYNEIPNAIAPNDELPRYQVIPSGKRHQHINCDRQQSASRSVRFRALA
jgi:hypothetical protein